MVSSYTVWWDCQLYIWCWGLKSAGQVLGMERPTGSEWKQKQTGTQDWNLHWSLFSNAPTSGRWGIWSRNWSLSSLTSKICMWLRNQRPWESIWKDLKTMWTWLAAPLQQPEPTGKQQLATLNLVPYSLFQSTEQDNGSQGSPGNLSCMQAMGMN